MSVECKKTKKITVSVELSSAMVMALGKAGKLCRVPGHCTRQRFFKKSKKSLPSARLGRHSAKSFFKKIKNVFAECLAAVALGKEFLKKKMSLPSALTVGTRQRRRQRSSAVDGCFSLPSAAVGPRKRLCRVPDKWPSAKSLFAVNFFSEGSLPRAALDKAFAEGF